MTALENAARQALNTLEIAEGAFAFGHIGFVKMMKSSIASLRQALEQPKQKPVAWWNPRKDTVSCDPVHRHHFDCTPLYTEPPKREWIGLTDEEIQQGLKETWVTEQAWQSAVWWAEQKLKELNA